MNGTNKRMKIDPPERLRGFDDYELALGDLLRGERATLGLSLLDVQRELRIKAEFLAAIENSDPAGFDSPGFIAGYVRSYARFLGVEPEQAFAKFCEESGFAGVHTAMPVRSGSPGQTVARPAGGGDAGLGRGFVGGFDTPPWYSRLDPGALGSAVVMLALIGGLGYGGWSVLRELQRVNVVPVEATPALIADVGPLDGTLRREEMGEAQLASASTEIATPTIEAFDRLYRPQALDVPVLTPRDGPIAAIDPDRVGALARHPGDHPSLLPGPLPVEEDTAAAPVQVVEEANPDVTLLAIRPAWVRVRAADGSVILEKILEPGETFLLPASEEPPNLRSGASGSVFFLIGDVAYGPAGPPGTVTSNVILGIDELRERYELADLTVEPELAAIVNVADASAAAE